MRKITGLSLDDLETRLASTSTPNTPKKLKKYEQKLQDDANVYIAHTKKQYPKEQLAKALGTSKTEITTTIKRVELAIKMADMVRGHGR